MADLFENPLGTCGFAFVEFTSDEPDKLGLLFEQMGFTAIAKHKHKDVIRYKQGKANFLLNRETTGQAGEFCAAHKGGANAMGFLMEDAVFAHKGALARGATDMPDGLWTDELPAVIGVGGSALYLMTESDMDAFYAREFTTFSGVDEGKNSLNFHYIDHLTHNVFRGNMEPLGKFYEDVFGFRQIRYFDIEGKLTGLISKAMTSPCGKIRIPINESMDDKSQIEEFLTDFNGEGIQHIAIESSEIFGSVDGLIANGIELQDTPDSYFSLIDERLPGHGENVEELRKRRILIDGAPTEGQGLLLQIFSKTVIGPVFFEFIQRKGNDGFGEGNFQALFDSIELDQIERGVIEDTVS
ncbi:MAG: 4-hydroxyphenylpyruvate dioxygenase [Robiginitomaculum sp.]|nr:MAG: 4-hydroxyphenylpyruvate dioxygenase [Robiginitomaculum sp.]